MLMEGLWRIAGEIEGEVFKVGGFKEKMEGGRGRRKERGGEEGREKREREGFN